MRPTVKSIIEQRDRIEKIVTRYYGTTPDKLREKTRKRNVVYPRQIMIYLLRTYTTMFWDEIAALFLIDHTTAMSSYRAINELAPHNYSIANDISHLGELVKNEIRAISPYVIPGVIESISSPTAYKPEIKKQK